MELRSYQKAADIAINDAWVTVRNILYVAPCRSGKTVQMSRCILDNRGASCVIAHRGELVSQMSLTLARNGVVHRVIGSSSLAKDCAARHMAELGKRFVDANSRVAVASVDTLVGMDQNLPWFHEVTLWITDEAHHLVAGNKWGRAVSMFPNARGLGVTATPTRADGQGLGAKADGVMEVMVQGPTMRELINQGHLAEYRVYAPPCDIDLASVPLSANGDFSPPKLAEAVHKSRIVGDIVKHYLQIAPGKLGMTFAVDIASATDIAAAYRAAGVTAEVISSKTPDALRRDLQRRHQRREVMQLVNVDLFGEGVDIPTLEVVSMGRPTESYGLFVQQFCRPLNPHPSKPAAIILDHVGNTIRHGLPDAKRAWTLAARDKKGRKGPVDVIPVRTCVKCLGVYEKIFTACPYCGEVPEPQGRGSPEEVDGDLAEMSPELLARLRGEAAYIDVSPAIPHGATNVIVNSLLKRHRERKEAQTSLRGTMALWGGWQESLGRQVSEVQRRFFFAFGIDVLSAMGLNRAESVDLEDKLKKVLTEASIVCTVATQ